MSENLLTVNDLQVSFQLLKGGVIHPVDRVSFEIQQGDIVGLVGESGCGKSMTALTLMRLVPSPGIISAGEVLFQGQDLLKYSVSDFAKIRGKSISIIFQDPMTYLNPVLTIEKQIAEVLLLHEKMSKKEAHNRTIELLTSVGIAAPERVARSYPFELSGGMRQRILIAISIACNPQLIIADEPTTALDVTIQAQIMNLLKKTIREKNISMLLITHDLGIVADVCNKIYVMYAGQIVESGSVEDIYYRPKHPYTMALLKSVLKLIDRQEVIHTIPGTVPELSDLPQGCRFQNRCEFFCPECQRENELYHVENNHYCRCIRWKEVEGQNG